MVALSHTINYVVMFLVAAGVGMLGGLAAELLLKRAESTGTLEWPHSIAGTKLFALGFPGSLFVGAISAVAILYFFPPVTETVKSAETIREYNLLKLVPLALIVGSAGPAFLATAQSRLMSALNAQKVDALSETAKNQLVQINESAKAAVPGAVRQAVAEQFPDATAKVVQSVTDKAVKSLNVALEPQVAVARDQIDVLTPDPTPPGE
jgi:hypothetical protein